MTASKGATWDRSCPGMGSATTRRLNPSAVPVGTRQPCCRRSARTRAMYRVRVQTSASRTASRRTLAASI
jgi:hypothetical protein